MKAITLLKLMFIFGSTVLGAAMPILGDWILHVGPEWLSADALQATGAVVGFVLGVTSLICLITLIEP